jgi:hypothetical protein
LIVVGTPPCTGREWRAFAEDLGVTPSHMRFDDSAFAGTSVRVNVIRGKLRFVCGKVVVLSCFTCLEPV